MDYVLSATGSPWIMFYLPQGHHVLCFICYRVTMDYVYPACNPQSLLFFYCELSSVSFVGLLLLLLLWAL